MITVYGKCLAVLVRQVRDCELVFAAYPAADISFLSSQ